jgi:hypothetical protein
LATVYNPNKQDEKNQKQQGTTLAQGSGIASNVVAGNAGAQQQAGQQAPSSSGRFTNIQSYMNANKGSNLGSQVAGKIGNVAQNANDTLAKTQDAFKQANVNNQALDYSDSPFSEISQATNISGAGIGDAFKAAGEQLNTQYAGPTELGNQNKLYANQQNLQGLTGNTTSDAGRVALLQQFFNKPTYASGQQRLDAGLLGAKDDRSALQKTKTLAGEYNRGLASAGQEAGAMSKSSQEKAASTREKAKAAITSAGQAQQGSLESQIGAFNESEAARASKAKDASVNTTKFSDSTLQMAKALGVKPEQLIAASGKYNQQTANINNINPEQLAVLNKIAELNGGSQATAGDRIQQGTYGADEGAISADLAPLYAKTQNPAEWGQLNATTGFTDDFLNQTGMSREDLNNYLMKFNADKQGGSIDSSVFLNPGGAAYSNEGFAKLQGDINKQRQKAKQSAVKNVLAKYGAK